MKIEVTEEMRDRLTLYRIETTNARIAPDDAHERLHRSRASMHADALARLVAEAVEKEEAR